MVMKESYQAADEVIVILKRSGLITEVTADEREQIAVELIDEGVLDGNWDSSTEVQGFTIRYIQEDHYDQHMDYDDGKPEWDEMLDSAMYGYVWASKD